MERYRRLFLISIVLLGLLLSTTLAVTGCGEEEKTTTAETTATTTESTTVLGDRAIEVLASTPASGEYSANAIDASVLNQKLATPAEKEALFLVDIRSQADYDKGHIEGATHIDFLKWADPENLAKLPTDKKIIVICYTGNTAAQAASGMRILGFDAAVLKGGMNGWAAGLSQDAATKELQAANNPVVNTPAEKTAEAPEAEFTQPSADEYDELAAKMNKVFSAMPEGSGNVITGAKLKETLDGPDKDSVFLLDIRGAEDFEKVGHIEGAVNIPFRAVAVPDNLALIPKDKQVVVICYTGNTAAQTATVLWMLDYDAVVLKYGMMGWTQTPQTSSYLDYINSANYPVVQ